MTGNDLLPATVLRRKAVVYSTLTTDVSLPPDCRQADGALPVDCRLAAV